MYFNILTQNTYENMFENLEGIPLFVCVAIQQTALKQQLDFISLLYKILFET